ncbi:MCAT, partial [Symbiodinium microadriaticum]
VVEGASATAGLSLGEYNAIWFSGMLGFDDCLKVVRVRADAMQEVGCLADGSVFVFARHQVPVWIWQRVSLKPVCLGALLIVALLRLHTSITRPALTFGVAGQSWLKARQKKQGLEFRTPALDGTKLSKDGKSQLSKIQAAEGWRQVAAALQQYSGTEVQVFNAAMYKALRFGRNKQGAEVYDRICNLNISKQSATFTAAMTIQSRLRNPDAVRFIWEEAMSTCGLDAVLASARIRAAAQEGDVRVAAQVLDDMNHSGVEIDIGHVTSAIRACWSAGGQNHNAAKYLFYKVIPALNLKPNIITMNCFVGALQCAPLGDILSAVDTMKGWSIKHDEVFAETFLVTVLQKDSQDRWSSAKKVADRVRGQEPTRITAARDALEEYKAMGLRLSRLCVLVDANRSPQGMISIAGLDLQVLQELCDTAEKQTGEIDGRPAVCKVANLLFPKGYVCSGDRSAVEALKSLCDSKGALQAKFLKTSGAFHTSLMEPAGLKLLKALRVRVTDMNFPKMDVYMNNRGGPQRKGTDPREINYDLAAQVSSPVLWQKLIEEMRQNGITEFYECGPMKQLK